MDRMVNVKEGNGVEVYRRLARRAIVRTAGHDRSRLVRLLTPDPELLKMDYFARVEKWEDKVKE